MQPRRYFILVMSLGLALVAATYALAWWLQPLYGDLTRIGGYSERDFGWNLPMQEFTPLAASWGGKGYEQAVDILVLGDSFANLRPNQQWQNWLAARTGLRIRTLDVHQVDLSQLVASSLYRAHPPRVVIWNTVERDLLDEASLNDGRCFFPAWPPLITAMDAHPLAVAPQLVSRPTGPTGVNPGFARTWLWKTLLRNTAGLVRGDSLRVTLKRGNLFTSRTSNELLIYRRDLNKRRWRDSDNPRIRCSFAALAERFEANGVTRFVTALAPDKSSAYRPWLGEPESLPESRLPALLERFPVPDARLDLVLAEAIMRGEKDVYMPDDTHWGAAGQALAADAILQLLTTHGLVR
jgi:hypothetical protein